MSGAESGGRGKIEVSFWLSPCFLVVSELASGPSVWLGAPRDHEELEVPRRERAFIGFITDSASHYMAEAGIREQDSGGLITGVLGFSS